MSESRNTHLYSLNASSQFCFTSSSIACFTNSHAFYNRDRSAPRFLVRNRITNIEEIRIGRHRLAPALSVIE